MWRLSDGECLLTLQGHTGKLHSVAVSPDGAYIVTASEDKTARVWRLSNGEHLRTLKGHTNEVTSAEVSPDSVYRNSFDGLHGAHVAHVRR